MKSETDLRMSYVEFSWEYDFPEFIEKILEDDYITRPECYDEASLKRIAALLLLVRWTHSVGQPDGVPKL